MTPSDPSGRLFDALVTEIYRRWPEYIHSRFTVAEIYQNLVPWRTHRNTMGIANSGEYEEALLGLLAGEGDYLALESKTAREEIQAELECRSPNTGIYRDFAAVGVRINPSRLPLPQEETAGPGAKPSGVIGKNGFGTGERGLAPDAGAASATAAANTAGQDVEGSESGSCAGCDRELPKMDGVRFCPFCGHDVRVVACAACGMTVAAEWSYCVGCGSRAHRE